MTSIRKNKLWKELYIKSIEGNLDILNDENCDVIFHEIITEFLTTGIDPFILLEHRNNNLCDEEKPIEDINKSVEDIIKVLNEKPDEDDEKPDEDKKTYKKSDSVIKKSTYTKKVKKDKK